MNFDEIFRGDPTPAKWAALGRYLRGQRITAGPGLRVASRDAIHGAVLCATRPPPGAPRPAVPWEVSATGSEMLAVAAGHILFATARGTAGVDMGPIVYEVASYAGGEVEVTGNGYLYARGTVASSVSNIVAQISLTDEAVALSVRDISTASVVFSTDAPDVFSPATTDIYYPVAQVALASGIASVLKQYLDHNPTHDLQTINPAD